MHTNRNASQTSKLPSAVLSVFYALVVLVGGCIATAQSVSIQGRIADPQNVPVPQAHLRLVNSGGSTVAEAKSDAKGRFIVSGIAAGVYQLIAESPLFASVVADVSLGVEQQREINLQFQQIISARQQLTVVASAPSSLSPDPSQNIIVHDEVLDANPGRPGSPISIPGLPVETASGGIKAPQYFAPGVAGDHGEPIAQFYQIGDFLYPNNLPANAHGNGYADPNFLIAPTIEGVRIDSGAFNVREGNSSTSSMPFASFSWGIINSRCSELAITVFRISPG